jgi:hypothetical protein
MTDLGEYLRAAMSMPWQWGVHDCTAWVARWAQVPLVPYSSEAEARAMIVEAGGLVSLWDFHGAGMIQPVDTPQPGDVGVIEVIAPDHQQTEAGAIFTGKRWAFIPASGGLAAAHAHAIKIWSPLCRRF